MDRQRKQQEGVTREQSRGEPAGPSIAAPAVETYDPAALAAGELLFERPVTFLKGVTAIDQLPPAGPIEIAFAGRSNVGKSSLINAVTGRKGLARTSNSPGRTQELNFFALDSAPLLFVDMPGYGYAEAPKALVERWTRLIRAYLKGRTTLRRVFLLIDGRHGIKALDEDMMGLMDEAAVSYQVVLTKLDKIKESERHAMITATAGRLAKRPAAFPFLLPTSAEKRWGIAEVRAAIAMIAEGAVQ